MISLKNFFIDEYLVTKKDWDAIRLWAKDNGYFDMSVGRGKDKQPVGCITWYDAVKFCNALSEFAGFKPFYYDDEGRVYRNGNLDLSEKNTDKTADGYRIPYREEWIYAAKGGTDTPYFWGNNELDCTPYVWQFRDDKMTGITREVGTKKPNPYGLYDIIGNACEWCFDEVDGVFRTLMGASVALDAILKTENISLVPPDYMCYETGMRVLSNNADALSVNEIARKSKYYGTEEWPKPIYPDMTEKAISERLAKQLDDSEFSNEIRNLINIGEYKTAFEIYRDRKFKDIKNKHKLTYGTPGVMRSDEELLALHDVFEVDFWSGDFKFDVYHGLPELGYAAHRYIETRDKKYLDLYWFIAKAYLIRHNAEFHTLTDEVMASWTDTPNTWAWGNGFCPGKRSFNIMTSLGMLANNLSEEEIAYIPPDIFAELAMSLTGYGMYPSLKDGREKLSNQVSHCTKWVFDIGEVFGEFKNTDAFMMHTFKRWIAAVMKVLYPDGSCTEQSLHYCRAVLETYLALPERLKSVAEKEGEVIANESKMFVAVKPPLYNMPVTSTTGFNPIIPVTYNKQGEFYFEYLDKTYEKQISWRECDRIKNLILNPDGDTPRFNSVFFPFGGTSVIRNGWKRESQYMYFFAPRAGSGHSVDGVLDVQFQAYGRNLIHTGGRFSYQQKMNLTEEQFEMMHEADKYMFNSFSRNTVTVDGEGQSRLAETDQLKLDKWENSTGYRWFENDEIVYNEGIYADGYHNCTDDVTHKREILFLKESELWIIIDRLSAKRPHIYNQIWHLPVKGNRVVFPDGNGWEIDGFDRADIKTADNCLYTVQKNAPNIILRHLGNVTYKRFCGDKNPVRGWTSYETSGRFRYIPVEEIRCDFNDDVLVTLIEATPNEKSRIESYKYENDICEFLIGGISYKITKDVQKVEILKNNEKWITLDETDKNYCIVTDDTLHQFPAPSGMHWEEKDEYSYPVYEY